eukprot:572937-Prymnesium_polylepis.2
MPTGPPENSHYLVAVSSTLAFVAMEGDCSLRAWGSPSRGGSSMVSQNSCTADWDVKISAKPRSCTVHTAQAGHPHQARQLLVHEQAHNPWGMTTRSTVHANELSLALWGLSVLSIELQ